MANRYAVATGDWSDLTIWDGGTLPQAGDVVRPNGFTVTIDVDITVDELRNNAAAPAVAGGSFVSTSNVIVTANLFETALTILYNINGGTQVTINGNLEPNQGIVSNSRVVSINTQNIDFVLNGNTRGGCLSATTQFSTDNHGIVVGATNVNVVINGTVSGGGQTNIAVRLNCAIISLQNNTNITVNGIVLGSSNLGVVLDQKAGIHINAINSTVTVNGIVSGTNTAAIFSPNIGTTVIIDGVIDTTNSRYAINASLLLLGNVTVNHEIANQYNAITNLRILTGANVISTHQTETIGVTANLYTAGLLTGYPTEADVLSGEVFGPSGEFTGTLSPVNVNTAQLATDLFAEISSSPDPLAERLRNVSTIQSTGAQIASLTIPS